MQFTDSTLPELLEALAKSRKAQRELEARKSSASANREELDQLRRENVILQTELRAELRRRGAG